MGLNGFSKLRYRIVNESEKAITAAIYFSGYCATSSKKWGANAKDAPNLYKFDLFSKTYTGNEILNIDLPFNKLEPILLKIYLRTLFWASNFFVLIYFK